MDNPKLGEVRHSREHRRIALTEKGFSASESIPFDVLMNPKSLEMEAVTVKRVWDGAKWVRA